MDEFGGIPVNEDEFGGIALAEEPDLSRVKLSPYEQADIASMAAGKGKALTGMESGTELTTAVATGALSAAGKLREAYDRITAPTEEFTEYTIPKESPAGIPVIRPPTEAAMKTTVSATPQPMFSYPEQPEQRREEFFTGLQTPAVPIPKFQIKEDEGPLSAFAKEAVNVALSVPEFFETPLGIMTLGIGAQGKTAAVVIRRLFLLDMFKNLATEYPALLRDWSSLSDAEKGKRVASISGTALMAGLLAKAEVPKIGGRTMRVGAPAETGLTGAEKVMQPGPGVPDFVQVGPLRFPLQRGATPVIDTAGALRIGAGGAVAMPPPAERQPGVVRPPDYVPPGIEPVVRPEVQPFAREAPAPSTARMPVEAPRPVMEEGLIRRGDVLGRRETVLPPEGTKDTIKPEPPKVKLTVEQVKQAVSGRDVEHTGRAGGKDSFRFTDPTAEPGSPNQITFSLPEGSDGPAIAIGRIRAMVKSRVESGIDENNLRISVAKDPAVPGFGFLQIDEIHPRGGNTFSASPELLNEFGMDLPSRKRLMSLPAGRYTLPQARALLGKLPYPGKPEIKIPGQGPIPKAGPIPEPITRDFTAPDAVAPARPNFAQRAIPALRERFAQLANNLVDSQSFGDSEFYDGLFPIPRSGGLYAAKMTDRYRRDPNYTSWVDGKIKEIEDTMYRANRQLIAMKEQMGGAFGVDYNVTVQKPRATYGVNVVRAWHNEAKQKYPHTSFLGNVSIREAFQNSLDAVMAALQSRKIKEGKISIEVARKRKQGFIVDDNGIGMSAEDIGNKFLSLHSTGKAEAGRFGGFGIAKAVILGPSDTGTWKLETRDNYFTHEMAQANDVVGTIPNRQGTRIEVTTQENIIDNDAYKYVASTELPKGVKVSYDDVQDVVNPFKRLRPERTTEKVNDSTEYDLAYYPNAPEGYNNKYILRLVDEKTGAKLTQAIIDIGNDNFHGAIIVDIRTTALPGSNLYPLVDSRMELKWGSQRAIEKMIEKKSIDPLSSRRGIVAYQDKRTTQLSEWQETLKKTKTDPGYREMERAIDEVWRETGSFFGWAADRPFTPLELLDIKVDTGYNKYRGGTLFHAKHLAAYEAVARLMSKDAGAKIGRFYGMLSKMVNGTTVNAERSSASGDMGLNFLNIDKTSLKNPATYALYLRDLIAHELTHEYYGPHNEQFTSKEIEIQRQTAHLFPHILKISSAVLQQEMPGRVITKTKVVTKRVTDYVYKDKFVDRYLSPEQLEFIYDTSERTTHSPAKDDLYYPKPGTPGQLELEQGRADLRIAGFGGPTEGAGIGRGVQQPRPPSPAGVEPGSVGAGAERPAGEIRQNIAVGTRTQPSRAMDVLDDFFRNDRRGKELLENGIKYGDDMQKIVEDEAYVFTSDALARFPKDPTQSFELRAKNYHHSPAVEAAMLRVSGALNKFQPSPEVRAKIEAWIDKQLGQRDRESVLATAKPNLATESGLVRGVQGTPMAEEGIWSILKSRYGIDSGGSITVVFKPEAPHAGLFIFDRNTGKPIGIELNRANIPTEGVLRSILEHEAAHWFDMEQPGGAARLLIDTVTPEEWRKIDQQITKLGYSVESAASERTARAIQELANSWKGRSWFEKLVGNIQRFASDFLDVKLSRKAAESSAVRAIAQSIEKAKAPRAGAEADIGAIEAAGGKPKVLDLDRLEAKAEPQGAISMPGPPLGPSGSPVPTLTPKSQRQIITDLAKGLNVPIRFGRLRTNKYAGYFMRIANLIGSKRANDLPIVTHEVGHKLDNSFSFSKDPALNAELMNLGDPQLPGSRSSWTKSKSTAYRLGEGMAEFVRYWLTDPPEAARLAPGLNIRFDAVLDANKDFGDVMRQAQQDIKTWRTAEPQARLRSHISVGDNPNQTRYTLQQLTRDLVDDLHFLRMAVDDSNRMAGAKLPPSRDPYLAARNLRGSYGMAGTFIRDGVVDYRSKRVQLGTSLEDALKPVAGRINDFRDWIVAKRAQELHTQGRETGLLQSDVDFVANKFDADPAFQEAFNKVKAWQDSLLQYAVDAGLVEAGSPSTPTTKATGAAAIREMNQDYVPFHRIFEIGAGEAPSIETTGTGRGLNVGKPGSLKALRGSPRDIVDPIETMVKNAYTIITASEKAAINSAVAGLADRQGMGGWIERIATPKQAIKVGVEKLRAQLTAAGADMTKVSDDVMLQFFQNSGQARFGENTIRIVRNGKPEFYRLRRELFDTFHALDLEDSSTLLRILASPAQLLRSGVTLAPDFVLSNAMRDTFSAAVLSRYNVFPFHVTIKGIAALLRDPKMVAEWAASGGRSSVEATYFDRKRLQKFLAEKITKDLTPAEQALIVVKSPLHALRWLTGLSEEATRLGEYKSAYDALRKSGMPEGEARRLAAFQARDRQDFAKGGAKTKILRHAAAFWNAQLQANVRLVQAFKERPISTTLKGLAFITTMKLAEQYANWDDPDYWDRPQWERDLFFLVPIGPGDDGHTRFLRIPTPFELGIIFGTFPGRLLEWYRNNNPEAVKTFPIVLGKQTVPNPLPQTLQAIFADFLSGKKGWDIWRGRPVVPESLADLPADLQWTEQTSLTARKLGKIFRYSPMKVDHLINSTTGGLGKQLVHNIIDPGIAAVTGEKRTARGYVPGGRFITTPAGVSSQASDEFYTVLDKLRQDKARATLKKEPSPTQVWLYRFETTAREISDLNRRIRTAEDEPKKQDLLQQRLGKVRKIMQQYREKETSAPKTDEFGGVLVE